MIRFNSDYTEGCHPLILERFAETNFEQTPGYGEDDYCKAAAELIRAECKAPEAAVHFSRRNADECDGDFCGTQTLSGSNHGRKRAY